MNSVLFTTHFRFINLLSIFERAERAIVHWTSSESTSSFSMQSRYWMKCMRFHYICERYGSLCPLPTITFALNAIISVILVPIRMGYINEYSGVSIAYVFPSNWSILWWRRPSTYRYTRVSIVFSIQFTSKCSNRMKNKTKLETFVNNNNNESKLIYYSIGDYDYGWKTLVQYNVHTRHNEWHAK